MMNDLIVENNGATSNNSIKKVQSPRGTAPSKTAPIIKDLSRNNNQRQQGKQQIHGGVQVQKASGKQ